MVPSHHKKKSTQKKLGEDPFWGALWGALRGPGRPNCQKKIFRFLHDRGIFICFLGREIDWYRLKFVKITRNHFFGHFLA